MKIQSIRAAAVDVTPRPSTTPRVARQTVSSFVSPMERYPDIPRTTWASPWKRTACVVTAEDGTWGVGLTIHGGPVERVINDHFAKVLEGQSCLATEKLWDVMQRISAPYGATGLASYAISAVDLALWDLKGKLLGRPVYELLGGPQKDQIFCYASNTDLSYGTENSVAWFLELGFRAVKLFVREGPEAILATGEHWYTVHPFAAAAARGLVDILQPDVAWVGGITAAVRICHLAEAYGQTVVTHAGMNYPWGQHLAYAMPAIAWGERSEGVAPPGVPLEELVALPGTVPIRNGIVRPSDAPGFGLEITREWLEERAV
jgi:L-alanine-DL-glutamate epimerase-like enolase superfamily enzyme